MVGALRKIGGNLEPARPDSAVVRLDSLQRSLLVHSHSTEPRDARRGCQRSLEVMLRNNEKGFHRDTLVAGKGKIEITDGAFACANTLMC